jgi:hypothetical protein
MNNHKMSLTQFELVSIPVRMSMTRAICSMRKNSAQWIQLKQEDKLILMMNSHKVHLLQFELVSIPIRMWMTKLSHSQNELSPRNSTEAGRQIDFNDQQPWNAAVSIRVSFDPSSNVNDQSESQDANERLPRTSTEAGRQIDCRDHPNAPRLKKLKNLRGEQKPDFGEKIEKSRKIFFDCFVISDTF